MRYKSQIYKLEIEGIRVGTYVYDTDDVNQDSTTLIPYFNFKESVELSLNDLKNIVVRFEGDENK